MATDLADHWRSGRVRGRDAKEALGTLARIADDYGQPGPPSGRDRDLFAAGFSVYAKLGTAKAVLVSAHAARLGTDEIRQIDRFRRASFDVLATDDEWSSRRGIRVLIAAPLDLRLNPEPELDGELRPGRSFPQSHVRLRASRTGDTAHTPRPDPNGERH